MLIRRSLAAAAGLLLAVPALSSCGFDAATDRVNTIGAGVSERSSMVDALGIIVVSAEAGSGNVIGGLANNDRESDDTLVSLGGDVTAAGFAPVEVPADGHVNLADLAEAGEGIEVTGDFIAGDFVEITFEFAQADAVTLTVPVKKECYQYEGLAPSSGSEAGAESPTETSAGDHYECVPLDEGGAEH